MNIIHLKKEQAHTHILKFQTRQNGKVSEIYDSGWKIFGQTFFFCF